MDTKTTTDTPAENSADAPEPLDTLKKTEGTAGETTGTSEAAEGSSEGPEDDELLPEEEAVAAPASSGIAGAAAAVVSAALGAVALTGTWSGRIVAERETLIGQIHTSGTGTPAQQISEIYGDAWHSTALVNGVFAFVALFVAILVLILPARPTWVRAVAVAGAVLGALGVILSAGIYFDLFFGLPTAGS
ncbi:MULTISPECIES: hypothetical protein [unclassified Streptomyces]|uniref:hypothetical protein n=1 Tax=unclassified Streptomyces TaxID=2593676 RepID=UPI001CB6E756|nr:MULTISPECIES: hypothetical protein [unclassified Streptomyces]MBD0710588.1 hypothetical protein [Streptomyces sp. CBMA291]MBD0715435.1 hypothetical protein [Streptomyces sp. CBMA370]